VIRGGLLESLHRVPVEVIARRAGIAKPAPGQTVVVSVEFCVGENTIAIPLRLRTHPVGFGGRRWDVECPCCGHGASVLFVLPSGRVSCWRCADGYKRMSERWEHRPIWRDVLQPLGRAGRLLRAAGRSRIRRTRQERLLRRADEQLAAAMQGIRRLGLPEEVAALVVQALRDVRRPGLARGGAGAGQCTASTSAG